MWTHSIPLIFSVLSSGVFFSLVWYRRQDKYLRSWLGFWLAMSLRQIALDWGWHISTRLQADFADLFLFFGLSLLWLSAQQLRGRPDGWPPLWLGLGGLGWSIVARHLGTASSLWSSPAIPHLLAFALVGGSFLLAGRRESRPSWSQSFLAVAIAFWGVVSVAGMLPFLAGLGPELGLTLPTSTLLVLCMLLVIYEEEVRTTNRHLLALSSLHLTGPGAAATEEIQQVLEGLLDRILGNISSHALIWVLPGMSVNNQRLNRGFSPEFSAYLQASGGDWLSDWLPRLGGILVLRDLRRQELGGLEKDPRLVDLRRRARAESVRGLTCIGLQSSRQLLGFILLGHDRRRGLLAGELRMTMGLSAQIAVALENVRLVRESLRRGEEFEILTHIGTAISSSLDSESLLRLIHAELQKLIDVRNFYVAFRDAETQAIFFELEIEDGVPLAPRRRAAAAGLTEYVLRQGQALLIPSQVGAFLDRMGLERQGREARSWMAAPIFIQGQARGVMAVQNYERDFAYDREHLRVLEIVAGQAAVALANARLFTDEQRSNRELSFLNRIAHISISTLNADEMLRSVTREIHTTFECDFVGIALIQFRDRNLAFRAESSSLPPAPAGTEISLSSPAWQPVLREGQLLRWERDGGGMAEGIAPLHPEARKLLALPVRYAGQTLGLLYMESRHPASFPPEQVRTLQTLSDQMAAALNNIVLFQHMQQQAITDGLTGLKTRRFFMESLQAEWKRAGRGGRGFALVLIDLNDFKQLNDTLGHLEGDVALTRTARILEQKCRAGSIIARFGGDEFTVLLPDTHADQARVLIERLRTALNQDQLLRERKVSCSFGLASYPEQGATPEEVLRAADLDMYAQKQQHGRVLDETKSSRHESAPVSLMSALPALISLTSSLDMRDVLGVGHHDRVAALAWKLSRQLDLNEAVQEHARLAGRLHDLGKSGLSTQFLHRSQLSSEDWAALRLHPAWGAEMIAGLEGGEVVAAGIAAHHEWFNGSGYPRGLRGDEIPLIGRILALAEAFDAMTHPLPYRQPVSYSTAAALAELERQAGLQFDPDLTSVFIRMLQLSLPQVQAAFPD